MYLTLLYLLLSQMIGVLIDKMLRTQIVSCPAVINWLFSGSMSKEFTKYYVWEIIHATLRKMSKHVGKIETELQEARDKSNKKKRVVSGQDKPLKALDTFSSCQRPVFSLGVSQHMHKITNL